MPARYFLVTAVCCLRLWAEQPQSQSQGAIHAAEQFAEEHPKAADAQNALGELLDEAGQFHAARRAFEKAIELKADYGQAYLNLGLVLLQLKAPDEAMAQLDQAIKLLGNTGEAGYALYLRAKVYSLHDKYEQALSDLNRAVALRPNLAEGWSDLGEARKTKLDDRGALAAFKKAVELDTSDAIAQYRLGAEYLRVDEPVAAAEHFQAAYKLNPQDQSVLNGLQAALRKEGKTAEAAAIRTQLERLLRQRDEAMQRAVAAVKLNNEGAGLQKDGNLAAALDKYQEASRLDPNHIGIRVNYAVALLRLGRWTDGLNELHEALRKDPDNDQIRSALKDALAQAPSGLVPNWNETP